MTAPTASLSLQALNIHRWIPALGFAAAIAGFLLAHSSGWFSQYGATVFNDIAWWLASLVAASTCLATSRLVKGRERVAWQVFACALGAWLIGQTVWTIYEAMLGGLPAFPHWMQVLFSAYDWLFVIGLLLLPTPPESSSFTPRHVGNLALIVCTLFTAYVIALLEPVLLPTRNVGSNLVLAFHCIGLASMLVTALYLLWSYRWQGLYWPLACLVMGAGIHTATYVVYIHQFMTQHYAANNWFNVSWLFVFGAYTCGAYERAWQAKNPVDQQPILAQRRERWLEALVPASLIAIMLDVAWVYRDWLSTRVAACATVLALIFAITIGLREMWIQYQEQRLLTALNDASNDMHATNRELIQSETRYRQLAAELERRVAARTVELEQAYRELENFSYAVAHDLKAPLRAVDGFGSMLAAEYDERLDDKGRGYLLRMRRSALKMSELIDDLLAYARIERREFERAAVPLPLLIDKVITEQREELQKYGVQLQVEILPLSVRADSDGLLMACRNILQNAIKFSSQSAPPRVAIQVSEAGSNIRVAITDNGIGFDMEYHDRIFEMFQRLHRADEFPGTGIGLAIVRKAVERMGGQVWAMSSPGSGATFYMQLPAA